MHHCQKLLRRAPDDPSVLLEPCAAVRDQKQAASILTAQRWVELPARCRPDNQHKLEQVKRIQRTDN